MIGILQVFRHMPGTSLLTPFDERYDCFPARARHRSTYSCMMHSASFAFIGAPESGPLSQSPSINAASPVAARRASGSGRTLANSAHRLDRSRLALMRCRRFNAGSCMLSAQKASHLFVTGLSTCVASKFPEAVAKSRARGSSEAAARLQAVALEWSRRTCRMVVSSSPFLSPK